MQRTAPDGALRDLANENEGRELNFARTRAAHQMNQDWRREGRNAEKNSGVKNDINSIRVLTPWTYFPARRERNENSAKSNGCFVVNNS